MDINGIALALRENETPGLWAEMLSACNGQIVHECSKSCHPNIVDDAVALAHIELVRLVRETWDPKRAGFSTALFWACRTACAKAIKENKTLGEDIESGQEVVSNETPPDVKSEIVDAIGRMETAIVFLPPRQRQAVLVFLGRVTPTRSRQAHEQQLKKAKESIRKYF